MLFVDDLIADRQSKPRALAGRLCAKKRLEKLVPDLCRNPGSVVTHPDFDGLAEITRGHRQCRSEFSIVRLSPALVRGIESIAEEVEEHARHILRNERDRRDI